VNEEFFNVMASYSQVRTSENARLGEVSGGGFDSRSTQGAAGRPADEVLTADEADGTTWNAMADCGLSFVVTSSMGRTTGASGSSRAFSLPFTVAFEPSMGTLDGAVSFCTDPDGVTGIKESIPWAFLCVT
jgi:hypothetical protein